MLNTLVFSTLESLLTKSIQSSISCCYSQRSKRIILRACSCFIGMEDNKCRRDSPSFISHDETPTKQKIMTTKPTMTAASSKTRQGKSLAKGFHHTFSDGFNLGGLSKSISEVESPTDQQDIKCFFEVLDSKVSSSKNKRKVDEREKMPSIKSKQKLEEQDELPPAKRVRSITPGPPSFSIAAKPASRVSSVPSFTDTNMRLVEEEVGDYKEVVPWTEKYAPQSSAVVALFSRKLKEVKEAIENMCSEDPQIKLLILSGPAGSSKSSILRALVKESLLDVRRPKGRELDLNNYLLEWENPDRAEGRSLPAAFQEFLSSAKYKTNKDCFILVDDIPNLSHQNTRELFNGALSEWIYQDSVYARNHNPGLVLIITEIEISASGSGNEGSSTSFRNADSLITERAIFDKILKHKAVRRIKFRPVPRTIIAKTLKSIASQEKSLFGRIAPQEVSNAIEVMSNYGDIRSAIMSLEYWAIGRSRFLSAGVKKTKLEQGGEDVYLNMLRRDSHLDLFHAVGKVVHLSSKDKFSKVVLEDELVVEGILSDWASGRGDQQMLSSTVFENYLPTNRYLPLNEIISCMDSLCVSDILTANTFAYGGMGSKQCTEIACELDIRGVRESLKRTTFLKQSGYSYNPLSFPRLLKKQTPEIKQLRLELDEFREKRLVQESGCGGWSYVPLLLYEKFYADTIYKNRPAEVEEELEEEASAEPSRTETGDLSDFGSDWGSDFDAEIEGELDMMLLQSQSVDGKSQQAVPVSEDVRDFSDDFFNDEDDEEFLKLL